MSPEQALALKHMDVVFNTETHHLSRVDRVISDEKPGEMRLRVALLSHRGTWYSTPAPLALVYRAESIPPGVYVHLGRVSRDEMAAIEQAITEREQEQEQEMARERNGGEIDHGNTE